MTAIPIAGGHPQALASLQPKTRRNSPSETLLDIDPSSDGSRDNVTCSTDNSSTSSQINGRDASNGPSSRKHMRNSLKSVVIDTGRGRYKMGKLIGAGAYGQVFQALDERGERPVAIKVMHSAKADPSRELRVLKILAAHDPDNKSRCVYPRDVFRWRNHECIVMDKLDQSIHKFLKGNGYVPFPCSHIQSFARQLFASVAYLKPENILLVSAKHWTIEYDGETASPSTMARTVPQRKVLVNTEIRPIDFGCATFQEDFHPANVTTCYYRAPEIILGLNWSFPCDIWSIGCMLVEFFTGDTLFQSEDHCELLAMMEAVLGGDVLVEMFGREKKLLYSRPEIAKVSQTSVVQAMKSLNDTVSSASPFLKEFLDLLRLCLTYDPDRRITAKEALDHLFFQQISVDDGALADAHIQAHYLQQLEMKRTSLQTQVYSLQNKVKRLHEELQFSKETCKSLLNFIKTKG